LQLLIQIINNEVSAEQLPVLINAVLGNLTHPGEKAVITHLPDCIFWLKQFKPEDKSAIIALLAKINSAQLFDIDRFQTQDASKSIQSIAELDEYTYLIAGCVGEFWTEVCWRHVPDYALIPKADMLRLGIEFGKGLQLVNILRDMPEDLRQGRCYLPEQQLQEFGLLPMQIIDHPAATRPVWQYWRDKAEKYLQSGHNYAAQVNSKAIRFATKVPALLGEQTLALLITPDYIATNTRVKVKRMTVYRIMVTVFFGCFVN